MLSFMTAPISSQFFFNLKTEKQATQKDLTFYKVARVASYVGLAALQIAVLTLTYFLAPQFTVLALSVSLAIVPAVYKFATSHLSSKIYTLQDRLHHFSGARDKQLALGIDSVSARLHQIEEDLQHWAAQKDQILANHTAADTPYAAHKKAYRIEELQELPLKIQGAYLSHLLHYPTEQRPLSAMGNVALLKSYKCHLDATRNATSRPLFIKNNGQQISREMIINGTTDEVRVHLFGG